ncbi:hypothetical protein [Streptomyces toxytricini]|uniref:Secreted protein n=1 Tax=Streptomyces toxytricini TaxID=67369 RepID=A0ABW8EJP8_STRT5
MSTLAAAALVAGGVLFSAVPASAAAVQPAAVQAARATAVDADPEYLWAQYRFWSNEALIHKKKGNTAAARAARAKADAYKKAYDRLVACERSVRC